jgi:hypothetical protein
VDLGSREGISVLGRSWSAARVSGPPAAGFSHRRIRGPWKTLGVLAVVVLAAWAPTARAQTPEEDFVPQGYDFCGWRDFESGGWTYDDPPPGVWARLFARNMTCRTARRHYKRTRSTQTPPYRHVRIGYRCKTLDSDYEYSDVRCSKKGRPRVAYRFQTGA